MIDTSDATQFQNTMQQLRTQLASVIVGNEEVIDCALIALFTGGHCLLEGAPGLGKTLLVHTLAQSVSLQFSRIQFTPDLMPADITGTEVIDLSENTTERFTLRKGPAFTNILLADEINRATPKTQSALLEAMQEKSVTINGTTHNLSKPFLVLATQNPIDMEGTYPLPEAQLDRFMFKLTLPSPTRAQLAEITKRSTQNNQSALPALLSASEIKPWIMQIREVIAPQQVIDFAAKIICTLSPGSEDANHNCTRLLRFGPSPRAAIALINAAKAFALSEGRYNICYDDLLKYTLPVLRHRLILNFEGEAQNISTDQIISECLGELKP